MNYALNMFGLLVSQVSHGVFVSVHKLARIAIS